MILPLITADERCFIYREKTFKRKRDGFCPFSFFLGIVYFYFYSSDCISVCLSIKQVLTERGQMYRTTIIWNIEEQKAVKVPEEENMKCSMKIEQTEDKINLMNLWCLQSVTQLYHLDSSLSFDQSRFQAMSGLEPIFYAALKYLSCPFLVETKTLIYTSNLHIWSYNTKLSFPWSYQDIFYQIVSM